MEIAGSVVGIISLGMQTCHSLLAYYDDWKGRDADIDETYDRISDLEKSLSLLGSQLGHRPISGTPVDRVGECLSSLEKVMNRLSQELEKLQTYSQPQGLRQKLWSEIQRLHYPFKVSTLNKLRKTVDDAQQGLHLTVQLLEIDITLGIREIAKRTETSTNDASMRTIAIESSLSSLSIRAQSITKDLQVLCERGESAMIDDISEWLSPSKIWTEQQLARQQRHSGRCHRVKQSQVYQTWLNTEGGTMVCTGIPGAGKTVAASVMVSELTLLCDNSPGYALAFWFCDFRRHDEHTIEVILSSWLMQICRAMFAVPQAVKDLFRHYGPKVVPPFKEVLDAICKISSELGRVFLVVDALDECSTNDGCRSMLINAAKTIQDHSKLNLLVTTRDLPDITNFENSPFLRIGAEDTEIQEWLTSQWDRLPIFIRNSSILESQVRECITISAGEMFLLVRLNFESLLELLNQNELRNALSKLPTGWDAYDTAYKTILNRIESRGPRHAGLAKKALSWTVYSRRPLEASELQHALAIEVGESAFDHGNIVSIEDLISTCAGLLQIDERSGSIRLIHATAQEYLERTHDSWSSEIPLSLVNTCITYLSYDAIGKDLSDFEGELPRTLISHPFYNYAAENWVSHAIQCPGTFVLNRQTFKLCQKLSDTCMLWFAQRRLQTEVEWILEQGFAGDLHDGDFKTPLHYAVLNGWVSCVRSLLQNGAKLTTDNMNMTALHYSAAEGNTQMIRAILEAGKSVDTAVQRRIWYSAWSDVQERNRRVWVRQHDLEPPVTGEKLGAGLTTLHYAALTGSATMTRFLLECGANPNALSEYGETPLQLAVRGDIWGQTWTSGNEDYWNDPHFMIEYSLDLIDLVDEEEYASVQTGVEETRLAVIDALLHSPNVDYTKQDCFGTSLLHCVRYGSWNCQRILEKLLSQGVRVDLNDSKGRTALHLACLEKDLEAIRMLLDSGADSLLRDNTGTTAFHCAAQSGSLDALRLISQSAVTQNMQDVAQSRDESGRNALHFLLEERGRFIALDAVQFLVDIGVHVNDLDHQGFSPLARFMERFLDRSSHKAEIADYLFSNGADATSITPDGFNLGHLAAAADEVGCQLLRVFVKNGVDLESQDNKGRTILHHCALHGSLETDEALDYLCDDIGLSLASMDTDGLTPLQISAAMRSEDRHPMLFRSDRWDLAEELLRRGKGKKVRSDNTVNQVILWDHGKISLSET